MRLVVAAMLLNAPLLGVSVANAQSAAQDVADGPSEIERLREPEPSVAHVRLNHDDPDLQLTRIRRWQIDQDKPHPINITLHEPVCAAPCNYALPAPDVYQFVYRGALIDRRFKLAAGQQLDIDVTVGSEPVRVFGIGFMIAGGITSLTGGVLWATTGLEPEHAAIVTVGGVGAMSVGLIMHMLALSSVDIEEAEPRVARSPRYWLGEF